MVWPLLAAVGTGAVLAYEKIGDWLNERRGVTVQPIYQPPSGPGGMAPASVSTLGLVLIGGAVGALWFTSRRGRTR